MISLMEHTHIEPHSLIWSPAPAVVELEPHQVDIWRVCLDLATDPRRRLESILSEDEAQRAARFYFPADKDRFVVAHGCLRDILRRYLPTESRQLNFSTNAYGKPHLSSEHGLDFNLSHSRDFALVAVTRHRQVGVDIEYIRGEVSREGIAGHFFSEGEVSELLSLPPEQHEIAFFNCWTRKEAYIKACGLGLSLPLESFDVSLVPGEPAILRATRPDPQQALRWTLKHLEVQPGYAAAVAVEGAALSAEGPASGGDEAVSKGKDLEFRLWDWEIRQI